MNARARFMLLCHGRVGTASLLEGLQEVDEVFVPSYWQTDALMADGSLDQLLGNDSRFSEQCALPAALDDLTLGVINHNFPTQLQDAQKTCSNLRNILTEDAHIFIWTRDPVENLVSSYKSYLTAYFVFQLCEGNARARGIYQVFNSAVPMGFAAFVEQHHYIVDYERQRALYSEAGYPVHLRPYEQLQRDLPGEIQTILRESGIAFDGVPCKQIEYPRGDNWASQVSFAFRNNFVIDGLPLTVGYFNPARPFPNQGSLTLAIQDHIYVAPDQWFRLPSAYKRRIKSGRDPWQIVTTTQKNYAVFEKRLNDLIAARLAEEDESRMAQVARQLLQRRSIRLDFS